MKSSQRNNILIILVALGVIATLVSSVIYVWLFVNVRDTVGEIQLASEEVQLLSTKNVHTQTVRRIVRDTEKEQEKLSTYFVKEEEIVKFLDDIEELGTHAQTNITVQSVGVGKAIDKDDFATPLNISLRSEGTLQQVFYVLSLLEAFPKALTVEKVSFTQNSEKLLWRGSFDVVVIKIDVPKEE